LPIRTRRHGGGCGAEGKDFGELAQTSGWKSKAPDPAQWVWTDDYSNIVGAVIRKLNE
jgi:hypothetical protein